MPDGIQTINSELAPFSSPILEILRSEELFPLLKEIIDQRIERLRSVEDGGDIKWDTQFEIEDLIALGRLLSPESDKEVLPYEATRRRDGTVITHAVDEDYLDDNFCLRVPHYATRLNPLHTLQVIESPIINRPTTQRPEEATVKIPVKMIEICDLHMYRNEGSKRILKRPSVGLVIYVYADDSISVINTKVGADNRVYEDRQSANRTAPNHPSAKRLLI